MYYRSNGCVDFWELHNFSFVTIFKKPMKLIFGNAFSRLFFPQDSESPNVHIYLIIQLFKKKKKNTLKHSPT